MFALLLCVLYVLLSPNVWLVYMRSWPMPMYLAVNPKVGLRKMMSDDWNSF